MSIHHNVLQNTEDWTRLRLGIPCASSFDKIITPAKGDLSKSHEPYLHQLLAEFATGKSVNFQTDAMQRGHDMENESREAFELATGIDTLPSGFWTRGDGMVGASPDRLIGEHGILELKNPMPHTHISYMLSKSVEKEYWVQLQGQLYVTERKFTKIVSYNPDLPLVIIHVERDEEFIGKMQDRINYFVGRLLEMREALKVQYGIAA